MEEVITQAVFSLFVECRKKESKAMCYKCKYTLDGDDDDKFDDECEKKECKKDEVMIKFYI